MSLVGKVALVTGATRGIGKGIALQLGQNGAKVYITGRTLKPRESTSTSGSLLETADEIKKRGGECIPVQVDHEKDEEIKNLFDRINDEQKGQLDILVNNAFKGGEALFANMRKRFWEMDAKMWDDINNVGLRNHYFCSVYAARLMVPRKQGLIVNITSMGGVSYAFNAAYGIGKAAVDKMTNDCGIELKKHNVACVGLLLGTVHTEASDKLIEREGDSLKVPLDPNNPLLQNISLKSMIEIAESTEFAGKCIVSLAQEPNLIKYSSKVVVAADYAQSKGIRDIDGRIIPSHRQITSLVSMLLPSLRFLDNIVPRFIKVPQFAIDIATSKFK